MKASRTSVKFLPILIGILTLSACGPKGLEDATPSAAESPVNPISISARPMKVERHYLVGKQATNPRIAHTKWNFHYYPELKYKVLESRETATKARFTRIELLTIRAKLACEVDVFIASKADKQTIDHEMGHVKICRDTYNNAIALASECAQQYIGKSFESTEPDEQTSIATSLEKACDQLSQCYRDKTLDRVNLTANLYDQNELKKPRPIDLEVAEAEKEALERHPIQQMDPAKPKR